MKRIYKFPLNEVEFSHVGVQMPVGAKIVGVHIQETIPVIYALVDDTAPTEERTFFAIGTGHVLPRDIEENYEYLDFYYLNHHGKELVYHLFEQIGGKSAS